jgi:hypothetical protein
VLQSQHASPGGYKQPQEHSFSVFRIIETLVRPEDQNLSYCVCVRFSTTALLYGNLTILNQLHRLSGDVQRVRRSEYSTLALSVEGILVPNKFSPVCDAVGVLSANGGTHFEVQMGNISLVSSPFILFSFFAFFPSHLHLVPFFLLFNS